MDYGLKNLKHCRHTSYIFKVFAVGFFATMCLLLPYVTSEDPDKGTEVLGYVASLLTVAFWQVKEI